MMGRVLLLPFEATRGRSLYGFYLSMPVKNGSDHCGLESPKSSSEEDFSALSERAWLRLCLTPFQLAENHLMGR
jgi:hypothetical protein